MLLRISSPVQAFPVSTAFSMLLCSLVPGFAAETNSFSSAQLAVAKGPFEPAWESLKKYQCPEWFKDAKFGIWSHWGPQCVPERGDWYARNMYIEGSPQYRTHLEVYGHPSVFGYKDIVQLWKAEKFEPERLMEKYKKAGAKYFVSMAVHHDNFDLWNSKYHTWNAVNMGPKKDIVGLWAAAARKQGLRFGVSEHLERSYSWFNVNKGADKKGPKAGVPYDGTDPKHREFYFPPHDDTRMVYPLNPPDWWKKEWFLRIQDVIDKYHPDLLYTDGGIPFEEVGRQLVAHFYNANMALHRGKNEAVYTIKNMHRDDHGEYVEGVAVEDLERGTLDGIKAEPWQTDTSVADWFYKRGYRYKTPAEVIHLLADIVSKNGNLLLNFTQHADGTLDEESEKILDELSVWMPINGEAIFGSRPWRVFGEGPNVINGGHKRESGVRFTAEDVRFTTKGSTLYAIVLGWPEGGNVVITSLAQGSKLCPEKVTSVQLLGSQAQPKWERKPEGLVIATPAEAPCRFACTFKIALAK